jgi:predicted extracellular nuclease
MKIDRFYLFEKLGFFSFVIVGLVLFLFAGCGLIPSERQKSESTSAAEKLGASHDLTVDRIFSTGPSEQAFRYFSSNGVSSQALPPVYEQTHVESKSSQNAGSKDAASGESSVSIPFGVKIGLVGVGLIVCVVGIKFLVSAAKNTAAGQAVSVFDGMLSNYLQSWRTHAQTTTDPHEMAEANAEIAELEAMRGKLRTAFKRATQAT